MLRCLFQHHRIGHGELGSLRPGDVVEVASIEVRGPAILAPFPDIAVHVMETPRVGAKAGDRGGEDHAISVVSF